METMTVKRKEDPSADPVTIQKADFNPQRHIAVNPADLNKSKPAQKLETVSEKTKVTPIQNAKPAPQHNTKQADTKHTHRKSA